MKYTIENLDPCSPKGLAFAEVVSELSQQTATMANYEPKEILSHVLGKVAVNEQGELLAYCGATEREGEKVRVGALAVVDKAQGNGLARSIIKELTEAIHTKIPEATSAYAYVHEGSVAKFLDAGYEIAGDRQPPAPTGCNTIVSTNLPSDL